MIKVKTLKSLRKLIFNNKEGELAHVLETNSIYKWDGSNWIFNTKVKGGIGATLYQINQSIMTSYPPISEEKLKEKQNLFLDYISDTKFDNSKYFCLLNRETYDFTIFHRNQSGNEIPKVVIESLQNRGIIKDINTVEDGIECWITKEDNTSLVYYFFNYQEGVIECL